MKLYTPSRVTRRLGEKLFLKAERDSSPKSSMVRRPYPPGMHTKRRGRGRSDFGNELVEKQKIKYLYGLSDAMLKKYVARASRTKNKIKTQALLELLERRLDNVVFRIGLALSRRIARQIVSHGHIMVNGKRATIPSRLIRLGERIAIRDASRGMPLFNGLAARLKKMQPLAWLVVSPEELSGEVIRFPTEEDKLILQNLSTVAEYYSR